MGLLNFKVGLDTSNFNAGLKRMRAGFNGWAKSAASGIGGQIAGAMALERVVGSVASLYEEAARIQKESFALGISTDEYQALGRQAQLAGTDIEDLVDAMNDLNIRQHDAIAGSKEFIDIFSRYGVHFGEDVPFIRQPKELFQEFARGMSKSGFDQGQILRDLDETMSDTGKRLAFGVMQGFFNNLDLSTAKFSKDQVQEYAGARKQYMETTQQGEQVAMQGLNAATDIVGYLAGALYGHFRPENFKDLYREGAMKTELQAKIIINFLRDIHKSFK